MSESFRPSDRNQKNLDSKEKEIKPFENDLKSFSKSDFFDYDKMHKAGYKEIFSITSQGFVALGKDRMQKDRELQNVNRNFYTDGEKIIDEEDLEVIIYNNAGKEYICIVVNIYPEEDGDYTNSITNIWEKIKVNEI